MRNEAEKRVEEFKEDSEGQNNKQMPFTLVHINFESDLMSERYEYFLEGLSMFMKQKAVLFREPGIYLNSTSSVSMQKRVMSVISQTLIKGETF